MNRDQFYEMATQVDFPDEMAFELTAPDASEDHTFSEEGFNTIASQMKYFMMARCVAFYERGRAAKRMRATLSVKLDDGTEYIEPIEEGFFPFFQIDDAHFVQTDGAVRLRGVDKPPK